MIHVVQQRVCLFLAVALSISLLLAGCNASPVMGTSDTETDLHQTEDSIDNSPENTTTDTDSGAVLWVMYGTDSLTGFPQVKYWESIGEQFSQEYPDIEVKLEAIPKEETDLQRLRTQIMAGKGPDVLLMCRNDTLIADPYQAMRNGLFADLSEYYNADTSINNAELNQTIMDAGTYDGHRYIIPYSYDFPVAYVDVAQFEAAGGSMDMFGSSIMQLYEGLFFTENPNLIWGAGLSRPSQRFHSFNFLPDMLDYDEQEVLITAEDVTQFLQAVQKARAAQTFDVTELPTPNFLTSPSLDAVRTYGKTWRDYISMYIGTTPQHVVNVGYTKMSGIEIDAIPLAAADGDLVADILFYGAAGAGCKEPELAYAFLRTVSKVLQTESPFGSNGMLSIGWPVRISGSAENIANHPYSQSAFGEFRLAYLGSQMPEITNDDIPFLDVTIDRVQFYTSLEGDLSDIIDTLNNPDTGAPTDVDIDAVAADFIEELEWHLYEG